MLTATRHLGAVGVGVTSPQLFKGDDEQVYVVKMQNNRMGTKVLVNELLAAEFGQLMNLCFPPGGVIEVPASVIGQSPHLQQASVPPGRHFASLYLRNTQYVNRQNLARAVNKEQMAGVMLFDYMFHNLDRTWNRKNLLLQNEQGVYRLMAIDNSHLFKRGRWTVAGLQAMENTVMVNYRRSYGLLLKHFLKPEHFEPYVHIVQQMDDTTLAGAVAAIPEEWLPEEQERQALLAFIYKRRDLVGLIAETLRKLIPDEHRSADQDHIE